MIYPIVVFGDAVLKKQAEDVVQGSIDLKTLIADMFETMNHAHGIGLAAPQIGKSIRMFIADGAPLEDEEMANFRKVFINPEMVSEDGEPWTFEEGCLSIPGIRENVTRKSRIRINYLDENFVEHEEEFDGMKARIIQHEYDHIEGILFTDHISALKRRLIKGRLNNITKGNCDVDYRIKLPSRK